MSSKLNTGKGLCTPSHTITIEPVRAAVELGAGPDVINAVINAMHHANRHNKRNDRIALALPNIQTGRVGMRSGFLIELIGSPQSLETIIKLEGMDKLERRGMIEPIEIVEAWLEPGDVGGAYVRIRTGEKYSPGGQRRMKARAKRRGISLNNKLREQKEKVYLTINCGQIPIYIQQIVQVMTNEPLEVSTYGLSSPSSPAVLPVNSLENIHVETAA